MSISTEQQPLRFHQKLVKVPIFWLKRELLRSSTVRRRLERRQHLATAENALRERTPPAFLCPNRERINDVPWAIPQGLPDPPNELIDPYRFSDTDAVRAQGWIRDPRLVTDDMLAARVDSYSDQIGRVCEALESRIALVEASKQPKTSSGDRILFDARSLQLEHFSTRGIGRYAEAILDSLLLKAGADHVDLFVDLRQRDIPESLSQGLRLISHIEDPGRYQVLVEPSPMTSSPLPLIPLLRHVDKSIAIAHDVIPLHFPDHYLPDAAAVAEYAACLDFVGHFSDILCNSHATATEMLDLLARVDANNHRSRDRRATVVWPQFVAQIQKATTSESGTNKDNQAPIVIVAGDEPRKNLIGALGAAGLATTGGDRPPIVIVGMAGHEVQVHHSAIASGLRADEAQTLPRVSDTDLFELLASAAVVIIPSHDEGLSLPVIEAVEAGSVVVGSDIPAHRELLGTGPFLAPAGDIPSLVRAIKGVQRDPSMLGRQRASVQAHEHEILEEWMAQVVREILDPTRVLPPQSDPSQDSYTHGEDQRPRLAFATPWPPQKSGVADYSAAVVPAIAELCELTLVTTIVEPQDVPSNVHTMHVSDLEAHAKDFDHVVLVLGNSSLHLPFLELLHRIPATVLTHDTRFVELYAALRGRGVEPLMLRSHDTDAPTTIYPLFSQQLADMRLLQNHAFWEVAREAEEILWHTPTAADRIQRETGVKPITLPFANYRTPDECELGDQFREEARGRLGFSSDPEDVIHLATFGFVDTRTKMADVLVESAIWLTDWGYSISVSLVGQAEGQIARQLSERAEEAGLYRFEITGYTDEASYRDYLAAADLSVQLRISPYLGVAGALSDLAARGRIALGSRGVCQDVGTPEFIDRLPDAISAITLAQAIESRWTKMPDPVWVEGLRQDYLNRTSPQAYAEAFMAALPSTQATA